MLRVFVCVLLFSGPLLGVVPAAREVDTAKSSARFSIAHIWVERVTGTVPILGGSVALESGSLIPQSATAVLDATSISTDEPDRDRSLESADFFDAARFPKWTFVSTHVEPKSSTTFAMDGNLTIHGVTQPERLNVTAAGTPSQPSYHAQGQIDRHAFGMTRTRLDPTIGDTADITLDIVLK
ncbi:MAG TPA: YceI family protein [Candidatus Cybelea sp.]|jgi:polyisoprenoid-binding protein YceI